MIRADVKIKASASFLLAGEFPGASQEKYRPEFQSRLNHRACSRVPLLTSKNGVIRVELPEESGEIVYVKTSHAVPGVW